MTSQTPRTVHLIWLGSPLPVRLELLRDDIARLDRDVEVRVWTDGDLGWLRNRDLLVRESLFAAKADIARYEILERHGGLYLDADFRVHRSLADVFAAIDRHGLVVARQNRSVYTNAFLGAAPGHPVLTALVEGLADSVRWTGRMTEPATTGPHYLTERIVAHIRTGGRALELPQHTVFPWNTDEEPIPAAALPASVLMSHDWSSLRGWSWRTVADEPSDVPVPNRTSRRRRTGRRPRTRAAATPLVHRAVEVAEAFLLADFADYRRHARTEADRLTPTERAIERWTARRIIERLRGSARFVDVHPSSLLPLLTASQMLDRPGTALAVVDGDLKVMPDRRWRDPSVRCSVHLVHTGWQVPYITRIESLGSALTTREASSHAPPLEVMTRPDGLTVAELVRSLPRCDMLRASADHLTPEIAEVLQELTVSRRIGLLLLTLDPLSTSPGVMVATALLSVLEEEGLSIRLGPWLLDGRGRTWRQHLRVAARPFAALVG